MKIDIEVDAHYYAANAMARARISVAPITLLIYGFFFFRYDSDPETCLASTDPDVTTR